MNHYKVRFHAVWVRGVLTDAHHFEDYYIGTDEPLESLAERLAAKGFFDEKKQQWIMPGAIVSIERN